MFNIARSFEDLREYDNALTWYRKFAAENPDRAGDVAEPIARLEARKLREERRRDAASQAAPPPTPPPTTPAPDNDASAELARLRALTAQLEALAESLANRTGDATAPPDSGGAAPVVTDDPVAGSTDVLDPSDAPPDDPEEDEDPPPTRRLAEDLLTDAYERVVVTASRYGQDPLDSPSTISVITADDIRLSGATNIPDILRRVAGVDVMSLSTSNPSVSIRGFNSELPNKVLWLIDGRSVYWDFIAAPLDLNISIGLDEIERIEIIRGPGSAVYGANAVTGVINIITRTPGEGPQQIARISAGHPDFMQASSVSSGRAGPVSYRISAGYDQEGRWAAEPQLGNAGFTSFLDESLAGRLAARKIRTNARFDTQFLEQGYFSVSGGYTNGFQELYNLGALPNYGVQGSTHNVRSDLGYGPVLLRTFWNRELVQIGPWLEPLGAPHSLQDEVRNDTVDVEAEGNFDFETGEVKHLINAGAGYRFKRIQFGYLAGGFEFPWIEHHLRAFVQHQLTWKWLGVVGALRLDRHPLVPVDRTLSPRGALIFRAAPRTSVRIAGGTAFRAMSMVESYMDFNLGTSADGYYIRDYGSVTSPNPFQLNPERIVTVEAGVHDESSVFHVADATIYWNRVTDLIGLAAVSPGLNPFNAGGPGFEVGSTGWVNFSDLTYDVFGGEVDTRFFPINGLDVLANVAIQRIFERGPTGTVVDGSSSLVKWNLGAMYRTPLRTDFTVMGHYLSPQDWRTRGFDDTGQLAVTTQRIPARFVFSARVANRPFKNRDLELSVVLWNPLGFSPPALEQLPFGRFREHPKGQPVGARLYGSLSYTF